MFFFYCEMQEGEYEIVLKCRDFFFFSAGFDIQKLDEGNPTYGCTGQCSKNKNKFNYLYDTARSLL